MTETEIGAVDDSVYRGLFDHAVEGIFLTSVEGKYLLTNNRLAEIYGFDDAQELMRYFEDIESQLYVDPLRRSEFVLEMQKHGQVLQFESQVRRKDGSVIWISENARLMQDEKTGLTYYEGTVIDISDRKYMEESLKRQTIFYQQLFSSAPLGMVLLDSERRVKACNPAFQQLFGYNASELVGRTLRDLIIPAELYVESENYRAAILAGHMAAHETVRLHRDGAAIPVSMQGFPVIIENRIAGIYFFYQDISERKQNEATIVHQAFHDALTGLANRNLFNDRLNRAVERARRRPYPFALVLMDLDRFKKINDTLGHLTGDKLLVHVASVLNQSIRSVDTASRLGGDEFALILEEFQSNEDILRILDRIQDTLRRGVQIDGQMLQTSGSMGIVVYDPAYSSAEEILRDADIAMYRAKEQRKPYKFFSTEMQQELMEIMEIESALKEAVDREELVLHYQPIVSLSENRLEGFEALVRWQHPERGLIAPDLFIPIAEDSGMILPIGTWVLKEACRQLKEWSKPGSGHEHLIMSVNVSIRQFTHIDLAFQVQQFLEAYGLEPSRLRLEITESTLMTDLDQVLAVAHKLKAMGVKLAIDDFGTGYSSLSYLKELPIDCLKIDRSFISGASQDGSQGRDSYHIIHSVTTMARNLGITVVAEGVESQGQQDLLVSLDCDNAQGYLYSRPLDAAATEAWLESKR